MSSNTSSWPNPQGPSRPAAKKAARSVAAKTTPPVNVTRRPTFNFADDSVELANKAGTVEIHSDQIRSTEVSLRGETHFQLLLMPDSPSPQTALCNKYGDIISSSDQALMSGEFLFRKPTVDISYFGIRNQNLRSGKAPELDSDAYGFLASLQEDYGSDLKHALKLSIPYDGSRPLVEIIDVTWPKGT